MLEEITKALKATTKELYKEDKRRRRSSPVRYYYAEPRITQKEVVFDVLEEALAKATGGGQYDVSARTLYYQVRPLIQSSGIDSLDYNYFSQTLLTEYQETHGPLSGLYYDPRGVLYEPHTNKEVQLGTREVGSYEFPEWRYDKILYVEKKGLWPILQKGKLAERYHMAIIAAEGYATETARTLSETAEQDQDYQLFVLHDADPYGYNISRTLREETRRMPDYSVDVIDLGLSVDDALSMGLQVESFRRKKALPWELRCQLNPTELEYFEGQHEYRRTYICKRIELNAMTAPQLLKYAEDRLKAVGARGKVIPPKDVLQEKAEDMYTERIEKAVDEAISEVLSLDDIKEEFIEELEDAIPLKRSRAWIKKAFKENQSVSWDDALTDEIKRRSKKVFAEIGDQLLEKIHERI